MRKHVFDIDVAQEVGVNAAILLENIAHWVEHNQANEDKKSFHDGRYWTYNSMKAFSELFPYLKPNAVRTALKKLKDADLIIVGNFNKLAYDRTQWYALTEKAEAMLGIHTSICKKSQMDLKENANGFETDCKPIPDVTSDVTPVVTSGVKKERKSARSFDAIIDAYTSNETTRELLGEWLQNRKAKRAPMTDNAIKRNIDKLDQYARESHMSVDDYLAEVIRRGWQAFYPIKSYNSGQAPRAPQQQKPMTEEERKIKEENNAAFDAWASMGLTD